MLVAYQTGARQLELWETPGLEPPEDGLILEVKACGVCGSDLRRWREGLPVGVDRITPGHEIAGVVRAVGSHVAGFREGDRLAVAPDIHCGHCYYCRRGKFNLCDSLRHLGITPGFGGGFAQEMTLPGEALTNGIVHPIPAGLGFPLAALAEPLSSVLACHEKTNTQLDDVVVVIGGGPIGCLLAAVAQARGAIVYVVLRSARRIEFVRQFNPDAIIDASQVDPVEQVRELTKGLGADVAICANPAASTQAQAVQMVRKGGKVVFFGGLPRSQPMTTLDGNRVHYGEIEVMGAFSYHPTHHDQALELLARGVIPAERLITHTFLLSQIESAFHTADSGEALKVMVEP